jgi:hypothetical protein
MLLEVVHQMRVHRARPFLLEIKEKQMDRLIQMITQIVD